VFHRKAYCKWLGAQLGVKAHEGWYQITMPQFVSHYGEGLMKLYRGSVPAAVRGMCRREERRCKDSEGPPSFGLSMVAGGRRGKESGKDIRTYFAFSSLFLLSRNARLEPRMA
jgi:hypothetical protein